VVTGIIRPAVRSIGVLWLRFDGIDDVDNILLVEAGDKKAEE
jgi:hypothetical protein